MLIIVCTSGLWFTEDTLHTYLLLFSVVSGLQVSPLPCFRASTLALRSRSTVTLSIVVSVGGKDTSYKGTVKLLLPDGLTAHQPLPYSCTKASEGVLCHLPSPMDVGQKVRRGINTILLLDKL